MFDRKLYEHRSYIRENFEDLPEIANWSWTADFSDPAGPPPLAVGQPRAALFTDS
jgi:xylulose-5-phosphate/fructose-6-phosphate phosphoketolase